MATLMDILWSLPTPLLLLFLICLYYVGVAVYRLYFSPLAKFPGPKLAALTYWVEFYHDVIRRGQFTFEIGKLHDKYGPIVRITPDELHIRDKDYSEEIYPGATKPTDKPHSSTRVFTNSGSVISSNSHNLHKMRRGPLNPLFSKREVTELAGMIQSSSCGFCCLDGRCRLQICIWEVFNILEKPDMDPSLYKNIAAAGELGLLLKHYPWIFTIANLLPYWLVTYLDPNVIPVINQRNVVEAQAKAIVESNEKEHDEGSNPSTVFHALINSDIPAEEKSIARLRDEGFTIIGAGTVTTAHTLSTTTYHVLANPAILHTLQKELREAMPNDFELPAQALLVKLEHLPYLSAVIKEGLRVTHAISHRNARIAQDRSLKFRGWTIPPGTTVSMTGYLLHMDPEIFPDPHEFRPERWLKDSSEGAATTKSSLEKYLLAYGRGSRICLGMNLANAELYMGLAAVFRRFELRLFETTKADVELAHDFIAGSARLDSKGVRVNVVKKIDK